MDFIVSRNALLEQLDLAKGISEKKSTIPILANVKLSAVGDELHIASTDLDLYLQTHGEAHVEEEGSTTLPAKRLYDIVRLLPEDAEIRVRLLENDFVQIRSGHSDFKLVALSSENFPMIPEFPEEAVLVPGAKLKALINRTSFAISNEVSRHALSAAQLETTPSTIRMVATDGHRLAIAEVAAEASGGKTFKALLLPKALAGLSKLIGDSDPAIGFAATDQHLFFAVNGKRLTCRALAGTFPDYSLVLPEGNDKQITLSVETLNKAVRRASVMASDEQRCVKFALGASLELKASSASAGEARETVELDWEGEPLEIGFNPRYVLDFLEACGSATVSMSLKNREAAAELRPIDDGEFQYRYVLMPMKA